MSGREHLAGVQREIKTCCVGQVKTGKVRLSGREHLAGVQRDTRTCCVGQVKTEKVRLSGREHLAGVQREIKTRRVGQVKTEESKIVWPGAPRRRPTGDQDSLRWTGKDRVARLSGQEHLAGVQREIKTRCVGQVKT